VDRNSLAVEKLSNALCLVFTKLVAGIDAYRITIKEMMPSGETILVNTLRHPANEQRVKSQIL